MIYRGSGDDGPIDQGDIIDGCPLLIRIAGIPCTPSVCHQESETTYLLRSAHDNPAIRMTLEDFDFEGRIPPTINVSQDRILVLTQTCDLANRKVTTVTVAVVFDAQFLVDQGLLKPSDIRGPIRAGRVFGWYFLPGDQQFDLPEMIVDFRRLQTIRLDLLDALRQRGQRRARVVSPYREHLAKHFADTFSRIGLPEPYETE